jgi:hypothetical protein
MKAKVEFSCCPHHTRPIKFFVFPVVPLGANVQLSLQTPWGWSVRRNPLWTSPSFSVLYCKTLMEGRVSLVAWRQYFSVLIYGNYALLIIVATTVSAMTEWHNGFQPYFGRKWLILYAGLRHARTICANLNIGMLLLFPQQVDTKKSLISYFRYNVSPCGYNVNPCGILSSAASAFLEAITI